jgi:hypothetical protein
VGKVPELDWDWHVITCVLIWHVARQGFVLPFEALTSLPRDRVLLMDRQPTKIVLRFISIESATRRMAPSRGENRATMDPMQGRWHKIAACSLWHFARSGLLGPQDSVTLTPYMYSEWQASTLQLMASSDVMGPEFRFMKPGEANRISDWLEENEGVNIKEKLQ